MHQARPNCSCRRRAADERDEFAPLPVEHVGPASITGRCDDKHSRCRGQGCCTAGFLPAPPPQWVIRDRVEPAAGSAMSALAPFATKNRALPK
jgi:hypothetical protein